MPAIYQADINDIIRNYDLKNDEGFLFCLFEALSNSLYNSLETPVIDITVSIKRDYKVNDIAKDVDNYIHSFSIIDHGRGFTDDNWIKFTKNIYKTNHDGGRGTGRIAFLRVFRNVQIESYFSEGEKYYSRIFKFDTEDINDTKKELAVPPSQCYTRISFSSMRDNYRDGAKKELDFFDGEVLKHFYVFFSFLQEKNKKFTVKFIDDNGKISAITIDNARLSLDTIKNDGFTINNPDSFEGFSDIKFDIVHIKSRNIADNKAFYVVDERSAGEISGINLPPTTAKLQDENGNIFFYYVYLKSEYFHNFLNDSRTTLSLPNKNIEEIKVKLQQHIDKFLEYELNILNQKNENNVIRVLHEDALNKTANNKAYMYILEDETKKNEFLKKINYSDGDKTILSKIRNFHEELQDETIKQINTTVELLKDEKSKGIGFEELQNRITELSEKVNTENLINLTSYIMYRKYVLELFNEGLDYYKKHKMHNEAFFHNLLLPKGTLNTIESNMWLLDDSFLYYEGSSETKIEDITISGEKIIRDLTKEEKEQLNAFNHKRLEDRIDLLFFPSEHQCIIIELKDPKIRLDENALQMDRYAQLLANFVKEKYAIKHFFTYLITDNFNIYDKPSSDFRKIYGIEGFVRRNSDITSYTTNETIASLYSEVIRFTDIYERAKNRNKIYFKKMGI
ncbi:MAG: hypothetical protein LBM77_01435 [Spirochaetaceae bacterium]|jgi:hypothetical protein|nr:hypothetical protein [Spirochaetaceae bacterium]